MKPLHLYVFLGFSLLRLAADITRLVLVLDWPFVQRGTLGWGIYLALDRFVRLGDHVHPTLFLDEGQFVNRP